MENKSLKNNILEKLIPKFLENIDIENHDYMKMKYIEYFNDRYKNIKENEINGNTIEILENLIIKQELSKWENGTLEQKKSLIINDLNLKKFYCLSNKTFAMAHNRLKSNILISENEYDELKKELNETYEQIEPYNKENAKMDLSESLLDLDYAFGKITNISSLRMGREVRLKSNAKH